MAQRSSGSISSASVGSGTLLMGGSSKGGDCLARDLRFIVIRGDGQR